MSLTRFVRRLLLTTALIFVSTSGPFTGTIVAQVVSSPAGPVVFQNAIARPIRYPGRVLR